MSEQDKALLELAAKAANINLYWMELSWPVTVEGGRNWNPLTDDGDALHLAVELQIDLSFYNRETDATFWADNPDNRRPRMTETGEAHEATRRAIVRAAAEIGKQS